MPSGEDKLWQTIGELSAEEICGRTGATFDAASGLYTLKSFGRDFFISPAEKKLFSAAGEDPVFLGKLSYFFRLSVLGYLGGSKSVKLTGNLINPLNMKSGQLFFRGSHVLPLDGLSRKYGTDREAFLRKGGEYGAERAAYGDASVTVYPLPNVPVVLILWLADEEFEARANFLFDSSVENQMPIDVVWSIAMLTVTAFL
jgi:hypothetical protein